jgi:hypothetical protein
MIFRFGRCCTRHVDSGEPACTRIDATPQPVGKSRANLSEHTDRGSRQRADSAWVSASKDESTHKYSMQCAGTA